jgi:hypothetical protein
MASLVILGTTDAQLRNRRGAGWEYAFAPGWSGFLEYDYIGLRRKDVNLIDPVTGPIFTVAQNIQMVKVGINVKLNSWANMLPHW